jgi:hypothetical protein
VPGEFHKQAPKLTPASGEVFIVERDSWKGKTDCKKVHMFVREGDSIMCMWGPGENLEVRERS